jgi:hypothetical protein
MTLDMIRGRSAESEEPDEGSPLLDSNIKGVAELERDEDGRYYAPHEFDGRPDVYAMGADPLLQALRREHLERGPRPTHQSEGRGSVSSADMRGQARSVPLKRSVATRGIPRASRERMLLRCWQRPGSTR